MDIRVLNYFITIVQTKSISNAADALHVTQPTLSRQIKELEDELLEDNNPEPKSSEESKQSTLTNNEGD